MPEPLTEVRGSQFKPGTARLVVELNRKAGYRIEERPQGLTVLIDAPRQGRRRPKPPRCRSGPPRSWRSFREMPEAAKPSDAPRASERTQGERADESRVEASASRCWRRRQPSRSSSPATPGPCTPAALAPVVVAQAATTPAPASRARPTPAAPNGSEADHARVQGCRRHQPPPHPRARRAAGTSSRATTSRASSRSPCAT